MNVLVVHGPNLNLLGEREPEIYGTMTLAQLNARLRKASKAKLRFFQSNHEGDLIDFLHKNRKWAHGCVLNGGALTHYSYALRDAIAACRLPTVEVHLSDVKRREKFRRVSVTAPACVAQLSGKGILSYMEALELLWTRYRP